MAKKKSEQPDKSSTKDGLYSLKLELENFKNIEKKIIDIGGRSMLFLGKNGSGKSSLIQAMCSPMDVKLWPTEPVKKGEESAIITHVIGGNINNEYQEYKMVLRFSGKDQKGTLKLYNKEGEEQRSPAGLIKTLIGNVSFDVTKWLNDPKAKKLETIKALTGCGQEIDLINMDIEKMKADGKYKRERAEQLEGSLNTSLSQEFNSEERDRYSNPVDMTAIQNEYNQVVQAQGTWDRINNQLEGFKSGVTNALDVQRKATKEIERLQSLIDEQKSIIQQQGIIFDNNNSNVEKGNAWFQNNLRPSIGAVNERMTQAVQHNERHSRIMMLSGQQKEMLALKQDVEQIKAEVAYQENVRNGIIAESQLPIPGLTFNDSDLFIDGLPLESGQINTARLWQIGVKVAKALNPNYKGIFLHEASLMDKETLKAVVEEIEQDGYFAICEVVAENNEVEAVFTEGYL